ncbi:MAG: Ig-like domain-containing protein [bacterium]|nr:Ig-like domain-containing protein [bacterium]
MKKHFYTLAALVLAVALSGCGKKATPVAPPPEGDLTPPVVTSSYPAGDTSGAFLRNRVITITFSEAMNQSSVQSAFSADGVPGKFYWLGYTVIFVPDTAFAANETVKVSITGNALDLADNGLSPAFSKWYRTSALVDITAPVVTAHQPLSVATNISISTEVRAYASEALSDWSTNSISLTDSAGTKVTGNAVLGLNDSILQFAPSSILKYNTLYTVTIDTSLRDLCWNRLQSQYSWSFRTELDTVKPMVVSVSPAAGEANVTVNTSITICFSEPMDHATAQAALSLTPAVAFSGYSWQGDTLMTATLADTLSFYRQYQVTVGTGALDLSGNSLASAGSSSFTTVRGLYVCCNSANQINLFQQNDLKPEGYLPNLTGVKQVKMSPNGNRAYVLCGGNPGQLHFLEVKNGNNDLGSISVGNAPYSLAVSGDGSRLAVSVSGDNRVVIINPNTMQKTDSFAVGNTPTGIQFSSDGLYLYVLCANSSQVERYLLSDHARIYVDIANGGEEAALTPSGGRLFATNGWVVTVIRTSDFTKEFTISNVSNYPFGLAVSPDGAHLAVSCYQENLVKIYDATATSEPAPLAQVTAGTGPKGLCYSPDGTKLYVSNSGDGTVSVISRNVNTYTLQSSQTITVGSGPWGLAVTP